MKKGQAVSNEKTRPARATSIQPQLIATPFIDRDAIYRQTKRARASYYSPTSA
jgi:hypothetical protein